MTMTRLGTLTAALACAALVAAAAPERSRWRRRTTTASSAAPSPSTDGPEAGVWVIAETDELEDGVPQDRRHRRRTGSTCCRSCRTRPSRSGSAATGWSTPEPVAARPDQELDLTAVVAASPQEAAQVYPLHLLAVAHQPARRARVPGHRSRGQRHQPADGQPGRVDQQPEGLQRCHQVGNKRTREIPDLDDFDSARSAWADRVQRGQRGSLMNSFVTRFGPDAGLDMLVDWTDRIAAGEAPPRPAPAAGHRAQRRADDVELGRHVAFVHDEIATDKRNPRVNRPTARSTASDIGNDFLLVTDTLAHSSKMIKIPLRENDPPVPSMFQTEGFKPWRDFGAEAVWNDPANPHNPMIDAGRGAVWLTTRVRHPEQPRLGAVRGRTTPTPSTSRSIAPAVTPATTIRRRTTSSSSAPATARNHLQFAEDANDTLYFSGRRPGHRLARHEGLRRDRRRAARPGLVPDRHRHQRRRGDHEAVERAGPRAGSREEAAVRPGTGHARACRRLRHHRQPPGRRGLDRLGRLPGPYAAPRARRKTRPRPASVSCTRCRSRRATGPAASTSTATACSGPRWPAAATSPRFDRGECTVFGGPEARDGRQCDAGWSFYKAPGPNFRDTDIGTDFHYYNWVDQFNTLGLGENIPIANGSSSDSLLALDPETGEWTILRVPYPQGFPQPWARRPHRRSRTPAGRAAASTPPTAPTRRGTWKGGPVEPGNLVKFQIRPDPLAH